MNSYFALCSSFLKKSSLLLLSLLFFYCYFHPANILILIHIFETPCNLQLNLYGYGALPALVKQEGRRILVEFDSTTVQIKTLAYGYNLILKVIELAQSAYAGVFDKLSKSRFNCLAEGTTLCLFNKNPNHYLHPESIAVSNLREET